MKSMPLVSLVLLAAAYALPWMTVPTVSGLTVSAYDLAEWGSIHPAVRADTLLLTPLLLRLPLVCLAVWVACQPVAYWLRIVFVVLLAGASLPPLEFFTIARSDANYQQQFLLALAALVGGGAMIGISALQQRVAHVLISAVAAVALGGGALAALLGMLRAHTLFRDFALDVQTGIGSVVFVAAAAFTIIIQFSALFKREKRQA
ncbi:MAG: hypothetical protein SF123_23465 [Chloroflexota bacterium]|nr:hypothetical protein [Chloroflexota bacterium]